MLQPARNISVGLQLSSRVRILATGLVLCMAAVLIYLPAADYGFTNYDDGRILVNHPELYDHPDMRSAFEAIVFQHHPREEPLLVRDITWAIDSQLFGFGNPRGFHLVNILLHACVVGLLFFFMLMASGQYAVSLLTTVCFLCLSVHVEPVAWIMGRKDLLAACFTFLLLITQCRLLEAKARCVQIAFYSLTIVFLPLALLSKINAIVVPGVMYLLSVLYPYMRQERSARVSFEWKRAGVWLILMLPHLLICFVICRWYYQSLTEYGVLDRGYDASLSEHVRNLLLINPLVLLRYLHNVFAPHGLSLFYSWPSIIAVYSWYHTVLSTGIIVLLALAALYLFARHKDLLFYFLSFFALMIPHLNLVYIGIWVANRYLYISSFCLMALLIIPCVRAVSQSPRRVTRVTVTSLVALFCLNNVLVKWEYLKAWQGNEQLWTYEMTLPNPRPEPFENLATYYYTTAIQHPTGKERSRLLSAAEGVIAKARGQFCRLSPENEPSSMYRLLYVEAIIRIVRGAPLDVQLAALKEVETLRPDFENVLWELVRFHYRRALSADTEQARQDHARQSLGYYSRYAAAPHWDGQFETRDVAMRNMYMTVFPFLADQLAELP